MSETVADRAPATLTTPNERVRRKPRFKRTMTPKALAANKANAQRPRMAARKLQGDAGEAVVEAARLARLHTPDAIKLLIEFANDPTQDAQVRLAAAREILDRGAVPRRTESAIEVTEAVGRVLIDLRSDLPAPPNWNGEATVEGPPVH